MTLQRSASARKYAGCGHATRAYIWSCICLSLVVISAETAAQQATLWNHNGSLVSLSAAGARRQFHYQTPAAGLLEVGVQSRTLLFDGRRDGNRYSGTAYVFSKVCGALPYAVTGPVSPDQRGVTMYGKAPVVDSSCHVIGHRDDVLVFSLSSVPQTADRNYSEQNTVQQNAQDQQPYDLEYDKFLQHWQECFRDAQSSNAGISACDSALSIQRGSLDDRSKLWQRRLELVRRMAQVTGKSPLGRQQTGGENPTGNNSGDQSCGAACAWCDTTTGVCMIPGDGPPSPISTTGSSVAEKKTSSYRMNEVALPFLAALVAAALLVGILWAMFGLEHARTEAPSGSTVWRSEAAPPEAPTSFPDQLTSTPQQESRRDSPEAASFVLPPSQPMALKLKRSERRHWTGKMTFMLDARVDLNAETHTLIKKYRLGNRIVYESKARERHREATKEHLESTKDRRSWSASPNEQLLGTGKTFYRLARAAVSATMTALSLCITIDSLIRGVHVRCDSMDELIGAERAIKEAATNLKEYLEEAATFDGREEIIEF